MSRLLSAVAKQVYTAFAQTEADVERLAETLDAYNLVIAEDEWQRLTGTSTLRKAQIRAITRAAITSAESIVATYNADLLRVLTELDGHGLTRKQLIARVRTWERERDTWKLPQIAAQEQVSTRRAIFADYIRRFGREDQAVEWMPKDAAEDYCRAYVERGAMPATEAIEALDGTHIGCVHLLQVVT